MGSRLRFAIGLSIMLLISSFSGLAAMRDDGSESLSSIRISESSTRTTNLVDIPSWKINDAWSYSGALDVRDFVTSSGVTTNVDFLSGTLTQQVSDVYTMSVDGVETLVYRVVGQGYYEAEDINLDGNNGDLIVEMDTEEIIRVSDLASNRMLISISISTIRYGGGLTRYMSQTFLLIRHIVLHWKVMTSQSV